VRDLRENALFQPVVGAGHISSLKGTAAVKGPQRMVSVHIYAPFFLFTHRHPRLSGEAEAGFRAMNQKQVQETGDEHSFCLRPSFLSHVRFSNLLGPLPGSQVWLGCFHCEFSATSSHTAISDLSSVFEPSKSVGFPERTTTTLLSGLDRCRQNKPVGQPN
jgi:hypothetical protein